jgi:hypothetical protein
MGKCIIVHSRKVESVYSAMARELFNYSDNAPSWEAVNTDYDEAVKEAIRLAKADIPDLCVTGICYNL